MRTENRRHFLRGLGVSIALPLLPSAPKAVRGATTRQENAAAPNLVCIGNMLGFYPDAFWPKGAGKPQSAASGLEMFSAFETGETSSAFKSIADETTVIRGLHHDTPGGHFSIHTFLSGVRQIDAGSMPDGNVTFDQVAAEAVSGQTRFPSLAIGSESGIHGGCQMSWTKTGTRVPPIPGPAQLFKMLFANEPPEQQRLAHERFHLQDSILDLVRDQTKGFQRRLNAADRQKLDQYLTSIRDVEQRLTMRRNWIDVPRPPAPFAAPTNKNMAQDLPLLYDLILLALVTGSTRIATLEIGGDFNPPDLGIRGGYHSLSHHGQKPDAIDALKKLDTYQCEQFVRFVSRLAEHKEEQGSLLDRTSVLFGSGMGNANSHTNTDLPIVVAGGKQPKHHFLRFQPTHQHRPPLTNLYVSLLQQFGLEIDQFSTSTGTLRGFA